MATATARTVTKTVEVEEKDGSVNLVLSKEEAETLREIFYKIGGMPHSSRRGHVQNVDFALGAVGVLNPADSLGTSDLHNSSTGAIQFADLPANDPARKGLPEAPSWMTTTPKPSIKYSTDSFSARRNPFL